MRILVTGGAGYIGSVLVDELIAKGHEVVVFDNLSKGHLDAINQKADVIIADILDKGLLANCLQHFKFDAVVHLASPTDVEESMACPRKYFKVGVTGGMNLLDAMVKHNVKKMIFASTAAVYGHSDDKPCKETDEAHPASAYGESKLAFEQILKWYGQAYGLRSITFRFFNVAGATERLGQDHKPEKNIIPVLLKCALTGAVFKLYGDDYETPDGTCIRDYVHVQDIARAIVSGLGSIDRGGIYNLSNMRGFSNLEVIKCARKITGVPIKIAKCERRAGDTAVVMADATKAKNDLGWQTEHTELEDIIGSAWDWLKKHLSGYNA